LLLAHPEIRPPRGRRRGLKYFDRFCDHPLTEAGVAAYHERFPRRAETIAGEWSRSYMLDAWTPPLLKRAAPDAKLRVMLSDPIERYRVSFNERLAEHGEPGQFLHGRCGRAPQPRAERLRRFDAADLVLQFERCSRDTLAQYRRTLEFLGVRDRDFVPRRLRGKAAIDPEALFTAALLKFGLPARARRRVMGKLIGERPAARQAGPLWPDLEAALHIALDPDVTALCALVP
jgi:hypothetical protein